MRSARSRSGIELERRALAPRANLVGDAGHTHDDRPRRAGRRSRRHLPRVGLALEAGPEIAVLDLATGACLHREPTSRRSACSRPIAPSSRWTRVIAGQPSPHPSDWALRARRWQGPRHDRRRPRRNAALRRSAERRSHHALERGVEGSAGGHLSRSGGSDRRYGMRVDWSIDCVSEQQSGGASSTDSMAPGHLVASGPFQPPHIGDGPGDIVSGRLPA